MKTNKTILTFHFYRLFFSFVIIINFIVVLTLIILKHTLFSEITYWVITPFLLILVLVLRIFDIYNKFRIEKFIIINANSDVYEYIIPSNTYLININMLNVGSDINRVGRVYVHTPIQEVHYVYKLSSLVKSDKIIKVTNSIYKELNTEFNTNEYKTISVWIENNILYKKIY